MLEKLTFVLPNEDDAYTFHMNYAYDSWNRMLSMNYPDGEEVSYPMTLAVICDR